MSKRDLADKYGASKNGRQLVNAAIRAELAGGPDALDALDALRGRFDRAPSPDTEAAYNWATNIVAAMASEIRRRYGMPPRD